MFSSIKKMQSLLSISSSQIRAYSTKILAAVLTSLEAQYDTIELTIGREEEASQIFVPLVWLRDHCQNPQCYNIMTNQRKSNTTNLFNKARIKGDACITIQDQYRLRIHWDDGLLSEFTADDILDTSTNHQSIPTDIFKWNKTTLPDIPRIHLSKYEFAQFCEMMIRYGVVILDGVEQTASATEKLCREITTIHDTYYGAFWIFSNESQEKGEEYHQDTAYGNEEIGLHTDGTYFEQTPGIQVFHCLHPAVEGGDTVLADGLWCVEILKRKYPDAYRIITTQKIDHHYLERGLNGNNLNSVTREKPVIQLDSFGNVVQIRFNPYDRAPFRSLSMGISSKSNARNTIAFYQAYTTFSKICHDPRNSVTVALRPGSVIFIDNFRVLHSRTKFKGWRQMAGCYLSRDNFLAKARPFLPENLKQFI